MKFIKIVSENGKTPRIDGIVSDPSITSEMVENGASDEIRALAEDITSGTDIVGELITIEEAKDLAQKILDLVAIAEGE